MYNWFSLLSTRQRSGMVAVALIIAVIFGVGVVANLPKEKPISEKFTIDMSIRDIAPKLEVTGKGLAREFGLPLETPKKKPLNKLGISQEQLDHTVFFCQNRQIRSQLCLPFTKYFVFSKNYRISCRSCTGFYV